VNGKYTQSMTVNVTSKNDLDFDLLGNRVAKPSPLYRVAAARLMKLIACNCSEMGDQFIEVFINTPRENTYSLSRLWEGAMAQF